MRISRKERKIFTSLFIFFINKYWCLCLRFLTESMLCACICVKKISLFFCFVKTCCYVWGVELLFVI